MKPSNRHADGQARIFNNALKSIKLPNIISEKASIREENLAQMKVEPTIHHPLTQNTFMHNILSSFEKPKKMGINENEYRFLSSDDNEFSLSSLNNQLDPSTCIKTNHLVLIQETLHMDAKKELDLCIKESRLWSLQQQEKDSSDEVIDECSLLLPSNQSNLCSWIETDRLASIQETVLMDAYDESNLWIKESRLGALQPLGKDSLGQNSSNAFFAVYSKESSGEISPDTMQYLSAYQSVDVLQHSSADSIFSCEEKFSKSNITSNGKNKLKENEKFFLCEELNVQSAQRNKISYTCKSQSKNARFLDKQKLAADDRTESVSENTNEFANLSWCDSFLVKEDQQSDEFLKIPGPESSSCSKVDNTGFDLLQEGCRKQTFKNKNNISKLPNYDHHALMTLKSSTGFFDSHCHLDLLLNRQGFYGTYADYMVQHKESYPESYKGCIAVFCKPLTFAKKFLWQKHLEQDNVWAAFGCHPKEALDYNDQIEEDLKAALNHHKVKALGEIGLDYSKGNICPKDVQQSVFKRQLKIARERKLRLVIHCRDADDDTINIMLEILPKDIIFHLHCFTGNWAIAQRWIGKFPNVFIGITNVVTYPSAVPTHEVARRLPLDRLLLETDAPYFVPKMAPEGTFYSHPGMAIHVAAQVAALQNIPVDKVLQWTSSNTKLLYDIQ